MQQRARTQSVLTVRPRQCWHGSQQRGELQGALETNLRTRLNAVRLADAFLSKESMAEHCGTAIVASPSMADVGQFANLGERLCAYARVFQAEMAEFPPLPSQLKDRRIRFTHKIAFPRGTAFRHGYNSVA